MKLYALQSKNTSIVNVFLSPHPTSEYLVLAEYDVDITMPTYEEARAVLQQYESDRIAKVKTEIAKLNDELKVLERVA